MSDLEAVAGFAGFLLVLLAVLLLRRAKAPGAVPAPDRTPPNAILVDGSNVMHWGGDPSAHVLAQVVARLTQDGYTPFVCFDANAGYKLAGHFMGAEALAPLIGVPAARVLVVDKGTVADEVLLHEAGRRNLKVVTNDRFRDWTAQHPWVKDHRRFRRGTWQEGAVVWRSGKRR